jgi:FkbM family methyltransferase
MPRTRGRARGFLLDRVLRRPVVFTDRRGLSYVLYPGENARVYFEHGGNYEVAETRLCERLLGAGAVAIDGGANIGLYSLLFAKLVGETGRVVAFEPDPVNAGRLRRNLELNGVTCVEVEEIALWAGDGRMTLHRFEPAFGPWHSLGRPELTHPFRRGDVAAPVTEIDVEVTSLDAFCARRGIEHVSLLKLDLEGAEPDALAGAASLLERRAVDIVLFEVSLPQLHALGHDPSDSFRQLAEHGYGTHTIRKDGSIGARIAAPLDRYGNYVALPPESPHAPGL